MLKEQERRLREQNVQLTRHSTTLCKGLQCSMPARLVLAIALCRNLWTHLGSGKAGTTLREIIEHRVSHRLQSEMSPMKSSIPCFAGGIRQFGEFYSQLSDGRALR